MLAENYGVHSESVGQQLADVAGKLVQSYWDNNSSDILGIVDGSYLMSYDDAGQELQFKSAAAMGVTYMLLERCGLDPAGWFDEKDFQAVYDFTTPSAVYALGTAVRDCSREVLRQIERTVKTTMNKKRAEGKHYYVYTIAGSAKFLRIYYARVSEYLRAQESPAAAICLDCKD